MNTCPATPPALFVGVETQNWSIQQFVDAANFAKTQGIGLLFIKVYDGANGGTSGGPDAWYGAIGGFDAVLAAIKSVGVDAIPYGFWYGDSNGSLLDDEISLGLSYLNRYGRFCADLETTWNGRTDWAVRVNAAFASNTNLFYVSLLADPQPEQNQGGVLQAMAPSVNVWMPQVYDDHLASLWLQEFTALGLTCLQPTIDLSTEFGSNNVLAILNGMGASVSIWEYQYALTNPTLTSEVLAKIGAPMSVPLSTTGEIADFCDADQFQPAKTQDACGFFSVAICKAAAKVGQPCLQNTAAIIAEAEAWYAEYNGDNSISNSNGMTLQQLYQLIPEAGLHYQGINISDPDITNLLRAWVRAGYPVIIAGGEAGMYDLGLGDKVPYYWNYQSFNHIITITGVKSDGSVLVRDSANVTDLFNPNSLRPGPRNYDPTRFQLVSATAVVLPWMPRPPAGFDPRKDSVMSVPAGWTDDGVNTLKAPNGFVVTDGFRKFVLSYGTWPFGLPLENAVGETSLELSNPKQGAGTRQTFQECRLEWTAARGVFISWIGTELLAYEALRDNLNKQIAQLQAQIALLQAEVGGITPAMQKAINDADAALVQQLSVVAGLEAELKPFVK